METSLPVSQLAGVLETVAYGAGKFLAITYSLSSDTTFESVSTNGMVWDCQLSGRWPVDLAYCNRAFVELMAGGALRRSGATRLSWGADMRFPGEKVGIPPGASGSWLVGALSFGHDQFLLLGAGTIWSSADGVNWTEHTVTASDEIMRDAVYGAGVFVAVGDNGTIIRSAPLETGLVDPRMEDGHFGMTVRTPPEKSVVVEVSGSLTEADWTPLAIVDGGPTGKEERVADPSPVAGERYYRLNAP